MKLFNEAAVRLGLALYRRTMRDGENFYTVYELVFGDDVRPGDADPSRIFTQSDFWGMQQEAAKVLDSAGLAKVHRVAIPSSGVHEYSLKLTPLGSTLYSLARAQVEPRHDEIDGITLIDVASVLDDEDSSMSVAEELRALDPKIVALGLSNRHHATVTAYVIMLQQISLMPERDAKLFWAILERLNQFAGVASLVVAIIALRLAANAPPH